MKTKELRTKSKTELEKMQQEKLSALSVFKFGVSGSKIKNLKEGRNLKREIAQILTILNESKK